MADYHETFDGNLIAAIDWALSHATGVISGFGFSTKYNGSSNNDYIICSTPTDRYYAHSCTQIWSDGNVRIGKLFTPVSYLSFSKYFVDRAYVMPSDSSNILESFINMCSNALTCSESAIVYRGGSSIISYDVNRYATNYIGIFQSALFDVKHFQTLVHRTPDNLYSVSHSLLGGNLVQLGGSGGASYAAVISALNDNITALNAKVDALSAGGGNDMDLTPVVDAITASAVDLTPVVDAIDGLTMAVTDSTAELVKDATFSEKMSELVKNNTYIEKTNETNRQLSLVVASVCKLMSNSVSNPNDLNFDDPSGTINAVNLKTKNFVDLSVLLAKIDEISKTDASLGIDMSVITPLLTSAIDKLQTAMNSLP